MDFVTSNVDTVLYGTITHWTALARPDDGVTTSWVWTWCPVAGHLTIPAHATTAVISGVWKVLTVLILLANIHAA